MTDQATQTYFDWLHEEAETAPSGGGGAIGLMSMHPAYFVMASSSPKERLFVFNTRDDEQAAKMAAVAKAQELGVDVTRWNPLRCLATLQYKDGVLVRDVSGWQDDQVHITGPMSWSDSFKLVNDKRVELGIKLGEKFYGQLTSAEDPNAKEKGLTEKGPDGEEQIRRVKFPGRKFASKEEALVEAQMLGAGGDAVAVPEGWSAAAWDATKGEIKATYELLKEAKVVDGMGEVPAGINALNETADRYGIGSEFVREAIGA